MNIRSTRFPARQRGAAIFVAIFLITVVVLAAAIVALTSVTQHTGQARAGQAEQAWYAALSCLEEATQQVVGNQPCSCNTVSGDFDFTIALDCPEPATETEGGTAYDIFRITATASQGDRQSAIFVRRSVTAQIWTESP